MTTADRTPVQLRTSYLPADLARNTPLADRAVIPEPWPIALADHTGHPPPLATSHIAARHPTDHEAAILRIPHTPPYSSVRTPTAPDGTPIDFTRSVWPGDTTRLAAHYPLPQH